MLKHDLEKIGKAVSKHSENLKGFGFSAKNLAENPKKLAGIDPQGSQLFGCMGPPTISSPLAAVESQASQICDANFQSDMRRHCQHSENADYIHQVYFRIKYPNYAKKKLC